MKKIDRLLISSFIPPFFVASLIAIFVLLMQTLWLYMDDIAGKGLGILFIIELLFYKCAGLVPLAMPIGILIASVMVMGNLAEQYELSSLKSAGIPLLRIISPVLGVGLLATIFSLYSSITLIPLANLKFGSRLWDIQQQKPTLRLEAGVFNYDFQGFVIHIGKKEGDRMIKNVKIFDHSGNIREGYSQITAQSGEMYTNSDGTLFIMDLFDGYQYTEGEARAFRNRPFIRTHFDRYTKVFDLSEFQMSRTDEDLFKSNRSMLSPKELQDAVDTLDKEANQFSKEMGNHLSAFFDFMELDSAFLKPQNTLVEEPIVTEPLVEEKEITKLLKAKEAEKRDSVPLYYPEVYERVAYWQNAYVNLTADSLINFSQRDTLTPFIEIFDNFKKRDLNRRTVANVRSILSESEKTIRLLSNHRQNKVRNQYEKHSRYSMAVICFIFVFIGAPMGALVKKGGFGYPILIAIIFFMLFVVLTIFCKKIAESYVLPAILSAWMPCLVLFPIGLFLTIRAMNKS